MRLSVSVKFTGDSFTVDVSDDMRVSALTTLISRRCGRPADNFVMLKDGKHIKNPNNDLKSEGFRDGDVIDLMSVVPQSTSVAKPTTSSPATLDFSNIRVPGTKGNSRNRPPSDTHLLPQLMQSNPAVSAVLRDPDALRQLAGFAGGLAGTELDEAVQRRLSEMVKMRKIDMEMETALEHYPEMFAPVHMLFISCKVGRIPLKAFVDSGAQSTIMSEDCARRCDLESLIDRRWQGLAHGVGTQTVLGRVHNSTLEINGAFLPATFLVLKSQKMDLLLGLDMLRRHQCCIDLKRNVLTIGDKTVVPFLHESEINDAMGSFYAPPTDSGGGSSSSHGDPLSQYSAEQMAKIEQLSSQGVPVQRAIQELQAHDWDVQNALISYVSSDDAP